MHSKICCLFLLMMSFRAQAQKTYTYKDTIFTTSGEVLVGRIMFMAVDTVFLNYYLPDSTISSLTIARNAVQRIGLSARRTEIIDEEEKHINKLPWTLPEKYALKGSKDAEKYYDHYSYAGSGTLMLGLLSPLVGLIPAISCSSTMPKEKNLNYPNSNLKDNPDYRKGYMRRAKKIKQGKVWTNWAIALGVNFLAVTLLATGTGGAQ